MYSVYCFWIKYVVLLDFHTWFKFALGLQIIHYLNSPLLSFWATVCKMFRPMLSAVVCLSVCNVDVLWPNGWVDQDETWHAGRPLPWPHCVRWEPSSPSPKGAQPPNFWPMSVVVKWLDGSRCHLVGDRPRPRQHCVRWGPSSPRRGTAPPPNCGPMSIVDKQSPISATAEHSLFNVLLILRSPSLFYFQLCIFLLYIYRS